MGGRLCEGELVLDGGKSAEAGLAASTVVGVLNPVNDRVTKLPACSPSPAVQPFFCRSEKNGSIAALSPAVATREPLGAEHGAECPRAKLLPTVAVDHDGAVGLTACDRGPERSDGELGGPAFVDRVAHDPVREHVFDRSAARVRSPPRATFVTSR